MFPEKLMTGKDPESLFEGIPATITIPEQKEIDERRVVSEKLKKRTEERMKRMRRSKRLFR